jgi:hypothetical protein
MLFITLRLSHSGGDKKSEQYKEKSVVANFPPPIELETVKPIKTTRQELSKIAKVSHDTIAKVKVMEKAFDIIRGYMPEGYCFTIKIKSSKSIKRIGLSVICNR